MSDPQLDQCVGSDDHTSGLVDLLGDVASKMGECGMEEWQQRLDGWGDHLYEYH